jgi:uncharacterized protein
MNTLDGTWLSTTADGILLVRLSTVDGTPSVLVDRPARARFRQQGGDEVVLADGVPALRDPSAPPLRRVTGLPPDFAEWCGWYRDDRVETPGELLLTQIPEADLGEPMCLVQDGDALIRAYPLDPTTLMREDGVEITLALGDEDLGGPGRRRLCLRRDGSVVGTLSTSDRFVERPVEFDAGGVRLRGTVILPATAGPHPAAVAVHGAAVGQRDYCRIFVAALLEAGVAALIYDKQGSGASEGDVAPSIFDQAAAASAALDLLAGMPEIDPGRIGLAGFSNGMWAVPMVAAARRDVAFVAGIGSPGVSMLDSEVHRRAKVLGEAGIAPASVAAVERAWRRIFAIHSAGTTDAATTLRDIAELRELLAEVADCADLNAYEVPAYARNNPMVSPVPPVLPAEDLVAMLAGPPDREGTHDPADDYRRISAPVFLQYGEDDTDVPVAESVRRIEASRQGAGGSTTIRVYPGLEHVLNVMPTDFFGLSAEEMMYLHHGFRFGAGVWTELTAWLTAATQPPTTQPPRTTPPPTTQAPLTQAPATD